jgi:hypothetical protein
MTLTRRRVSPKVRSINRPWGQSSLLVRDLADVEAAQMLLEPLDHPAVALGVQPRCSASVRSAWTSASWSTSAGANSGAGT